MDLGWVSQLEAMGVFWVDEQDKQVDPLAALKKMGVDSVRLRVFVNPPESGIWKKRENETCMLGFSDAAGVLEMSKRVKENGMKLMIDFHYSDHFADPQFQDIPEAWEKDSDEELAAHVYGHTKEVLTLLTESHIYPEWVQVGNEINPGVLLPKGSVREHPEAMVAFLNAGYEAVKACCPDCQVITHLASGAFYNECKAFYDTFFRLGGKTDIIGLSHYPYWYELFAPGKMDDLADCMSKYVTSYGKPVMVVEVGELETEPDKSYQLLCDTIEAIKSIPGEQETGIFYWEPEVGKNLLPDGYPLGAAVLVGEKKLRFTKAMEAYLTI